MLVLPLRIRNSALAMGMALALRERAAQSSGSYNSGCAEGASLCDPLELSMLPISTEIFIRCTAWAAASLSDHGDGSCSSSVHGEGWSRGEP